MAAVVDTEVAVDTAVAISEPLRPSAPIPERPSVPEAAFFVVGDVPASAGPVQGHHRGKMAEFWVIQFLMCL
jgi:hypothetical protein